MAIQINGNVTITGISVVGLPNGIVDTDMLAANAVSSAKIASGATVTGWTHQSYSAVGSVSAHTVCVPTTSTALRIGVMGLSSNTGSSGSESYAALRLGTASGLLDVNYDTISSYLEDSYQEVNTWSSRAILYPMNYGRSQHVFNGQIECWKMGGTDRWYINSQFSRGAAEGHQTHFFMQSSIDLGGDITQFSIFLNTGSFDGGSVGSSYYED